MKQILSLLCALMTFSTVHAEHVIEANPSNLTKVLATLRKTLRQRPDEDYVVQLATGEYCLTSPLDLDASYSGRNGHTVTLRAAEGATPVISGGQRLTGWQHVSGNLWRVPLQCPHKVRALWVNGQHAVMAAATHRSQGAGVHAYTDITGQEPWAFGAGQGVDAIKMVMDDELFLFRNPEDVEIVQEKVWTEKILAPRAFDKWGDTLIVYLQQPLGAILNSMAWAGRIDYNKLFHFRNAYELLDEPGEFYFDRQAQMLYYYSRGEDMTTAEAIVPLSEGLLRLHGESREKRLQHVRLEGITFAYDHWNLMQLAGSTGFGGIQSLGLAYRYIPDGNWHPTRYNSCDTPAGCVDVYNASDVVIDRCQFIHLASASAVTMLNDVSESAITGCIFQDIYGNALTVGHPQHYEIGDGEGRYATTVEGLCHNIQVCNNYIRNVSLDFRQCEAVLGFFVRQVHIDHNDIQGCPYGAVALGWWWGNAGTPEPTLAGCNSISFNKIGKTHQLLSDGGIVYMLGPQPGSVMEGNYLFKGPRCIYPDDGSAGWVIHDNVINSVGQLWFHIDSDRDYDIHAYHNYVKANNVANSGRGTTVTDTQTFRNVDFNDEAKTIIDSAGLSPRYRSILPAEEPDPIRLHPDFNIKRW